MSARTPGPWSYSEKGPHIYGPRHNSSRHANGRQHIAEVSSAQTDKTDPEAIANARLIAAAPDLLAALRDLVSAEGLPEGYANRAMLIDAARAALAKAGVM